MRHGFLAMFIGERQRLENRFRMIRHFTAVMHDGDMGSQLVTVSCRLSLTTVTKGRNWYTLASTWAFLIRSIFVIPNKMFRRGTPHIPVSSDVSVVASCLTTLTSFYILIPAPILGS